MSYLEAVKGKRCHLSLVIATLSGAGQQPLKLPAATTKALAQAFEAFQASAGCPEATPGLPPEPQKGQNPWLRSQSGVLRNESWR
ncbi:hypothetical protein [Pseudomonas sp. Marseille-QA0332]